MNIPRLTPMRGPLVSRATLGWQTMLADLALILFMVSAAAMADGPDRHADGPDRHADGPDKAGVPKPAPSKPPPSALALPAIPARGEPLALWRDTPDAPALATWLARQQADPRQQLTITLRYRPDQLAAAMARGAALARGADAAGGAGSRARIIFEPSARPGRAGIDAVAALAYDRGGE